MKVFKRLAFYTGLATGIAAVAGVGAVGLTYLFTDKFPVVNISDKGTKATLLAPGEMGTMIKEQMRRAREARARQAEGEDDEEDEA